MDMRELCRQAGIKRPETDMAWHLWEKAMQLATLAAARKCAEMCAELDTKAKGLDMPEALDCAQAIRKEFGIEG